MDNTKKIAVEMLKKNFAEAKELVFKSLYAKASLALDEARFAVANGVFNEDSEQIEEEIDQLDEKMTRKHFQQVADVIKSNPDAKKREELAKHHSEIFKKSNPRFDQARFDKACGVGGCKPVKEDLQTRARYWETDNDELEANERGDQDRYWKLARKHDKERAHKTKKYGVGGKVIAKRKINKQTSKPTKWKST